MANGNSTDSEGSPRDFVLELLGYVIAHPEAKDTIDGIEKWWLAKSVCLEEKRKLEKILNLLVSKGWLNGRHSPAGTIYSMNESRLAEIKRFVET
jgi:hypothetical protein